MHKMHNSFSMPQWEECQASGKWENERKSNQTADHLPKCISLMFSIFATTSSPSTPHKTTVYIHLYYILDNPLHFFNTSNFAPINDVPPPHTSHFPHPPILRLPSPQNTSSLSGLTYICYIIAALTQLFLYCFGGNHVSESVSTTPDHTPKSPPLSTFPSSAHFHFHHSFGLRYSGEGVVTELDAIGVLSKLT